MKRKTMITLALAVLLSACAQSTPPQTLSEKLDGLSPAEKQEVLRLACLNEAEYTTKIKKAKYHGPSKRRHLVPETEETKRLKTLCREMTDTYEQKE